MSGQVVAREFVNCRIPLFLRRLVTMAPALTILAVGVNSSHALTVSQIVLSFGIPFALIPLSIFCRTYSLKGALTNHRLTTAIATVVVALIVSLNAFLLYQTFFGWRTYELKDCFIWPMPVTNGSYILPPPWRMRVH